MNNNSIKYESLDRLRSSIVLGFMVVGIWYLHWRFSTLSDAAPFFSVTLYAAEIYGFCSSMLNAFTCWRLTVRQASPPLDGKSVDVFIPTYNEPVNLVRKTVIAAINMEYPHETWLLDDGNRPEMKELAERLKVRYIARTENLHAKAGNLNNALMHSKGEFIAVFDADHAPQNNFLTRVLGYFADDQVAFVQTPQDFFNLDSYMHRAQEDKRQIWSEQSLFFSVILRGRDYWNAAFFCGSCGVLRRSALEKIGGFATETVTEDIHTSVRLHKAGFRSVYHCESLAYGIAPATADPFLKQRIRWGQGNMQVLMKENILFTSKLTLAQKTNYIASIMTWFDGWQKGIFYVTPIIILFTGVLPINTGLNELLLHVIPYYLLGLLVFEEVGRGYGGTLYIEQYNFIRFAAYIQSTFGLFLGKLKFQVTSKVRDSSVKRNSNLWPAMAILLFSTAAAPFGIVSYLGGSTLPPDALSYNLFWVGVNCFIGFSAFKFTKKSQDFTRNEYRFPIPLPFRFEDKKQTNLYGTIDNISATGGKIYARLPRSARKGRIIEGYIYLPSGPIPIAAEIVAEFKSLAGDQPFVAAVGCRFIWNVVEHQDAFESFLFGTDLQCKLNEIEEKQATPIEWLKRKIAGIRIPKRDEGEHWAPVVIIGENYQAPTSLGLVNISGSGEAPRQLISFSPISQNAEVAVRIYTRTRQIDLGIEVTEGIQLQSSGDSFFLYPVKKSTMIATKASHLFVNKTEVFKI